MQRLLCLSRSSKIDQAHLTTVITTVKMSYITNPIITSALIDALAPVQEVSPAPLVDVIRAPPHYHRFWSATRARKFARKLTGDLKRRGTYDQNIRLIASKTHPGVDVRQFIHKVNPVLWCLTVGWSRCDVQKLIMRNDFQALWHRCAYSSCDHCRYLADKHSGFWFFNYGPIPSNPLRTCV